MPTRGARCHGAGGAGGVGPGASVLVAVLALLVAAPGAMGPDRAGDRGGDRVAADPAPDVELRLADTPAPSHDLVPPDPPARSPDPSIRSLPSRPGAWPAAHVARSARTAAWTTTLPPPALR